MIRKKDLWATIERLESERDDLVAENKRLVAKNTELLLQTETQRLNAKLHRMAQWEYRESD